MLDEWGALLTTDVVASRTLSGAGGGGRLRFAAATNNVRQRTKTTGSKVHGKEGKAVRPVCVPHGQLTRTDLDRVWGTKQLLRRVHAMPTRSIDLRFDRLLNV